MTMHKHHAHRHKKENPPHFIAAIAIAMFLVLLGWVATFRINRNGKSESLWSIFQGAQEQVRSIFSDTTTAQRDEAKVEELRQRVFPEFE